MARRRHCEDEEESPVVKRSINSNQDDESSIKSFVEKVVERSDPSRTRVEKVESKEDEPHEVFEFQTEGSFRFYIDNLKELSIDEPFASFTHHVVNIPWSLEVKRIRSTENRSMQLLAVHLRCHDQNTASDSWSCLARYELTLISKLGRKHDVSSRAVEARLFGPSMNSWGTNALVTWSKLFEPSNGFVHEDGSVVIEAKIEVKESTGFMRTPLSKFGENALADMVLIVEGKRIHVNRYYLAIHSPFFYREFFGDSQKENRTEMELSDDVKFEEMVEFLKVIYPECRQITSENVDFLLYLADRFEVRNVLRLCAEHLSRARDIPLALRLYCADKYGLTVVADQCFKDIRKNSDMNKIVKSSYFSKLSVTMNKLLLVRMVEMNKRDA